MGLYIRKAKNFALALIIAASAALAAAPAALAEITDPAYVKVRDEMKAMYLVQGLLSWYTRTQGERSVFTESYKGHESLYTKKTIDMVNNILKNSKGLSDDDKRAAQFMINSLTLEYVGIDTAHFDDEINNAEASATVKLDWLAEPTPYRQISVLMDQEKDPDKRQKIQAAQAQVWKDVLNPIYARQEARVQELAVELGYQGIVPISEQLRNVNLKDLIAKSQKLIKDSDALYREMFPEQVRKVMGIEPEKFTRADIGFFGSVPAYKKFFPPELTIPAFLDFLDGMGLDMKTAAGTDIVIDDELREKKEPRAACYSISVPDDIRMTLKPSGGIPDFETFFHESGHALHFANSTTPVWEFQQLGNNAITESYAIFFENVWGDPQWLMHYREFVKGYNRFQPPAKKVPLMTDAEIGELMRNRLFWDLYFVRRYNGAKLLYESILHNGDKSFYENYYNGQTSDLHQVYKSLFSDAYGFNLTDSDALRFRTDVDGFFYAADYSRAFLLSAQLDQYMRDKFGANWFTNPESGKIMKKVWARSNALQPDELAAELGQKALSPDYFLSRMKYRLDAAGKLIKGQK